MNNIINKRKLEQVKRAEKNSRINCDKYKLGFHLMPPTGWLNDPNGLCQFKGIYHVFFQYSPFDANGGEKFWGHYTSKDMISWKYEGVAMAPDTKFDKDGVFSGSAFVENEKMYIYYTGNVEEPGKHDYVTSGRQSNTILVISDGKFLGPKIVLMTNKNYPSTYTCHIRDPKVWKEQGKYYMVLGGREMVDGTETNDIGKVLLYSSCDLINWKLKNEIATTKRFGYMWECPDMITLNGDKFLSVSPQGLEAYIFKYQNVYQSGYFPIKGDLKEQYSLGEFVEWDMGFDFYAPQTFVDESGRTILIGWMGLPDIDYTNKTLEYGWQHNLTLPRKLNLKNSKILQKPIDELKQLRINREEAHLDEEINLSGLNEININGDIEELEIVIAHGLRINYESETSIFSMQFKNRIGAGRNIRRTKIENLNKLQIFIDKSCIEVFLNDGEKVFSTRFYPCEYTLRISSNNNVNIELWNLSSMEVVF